MEWNEDMSGSAKRFTVIVRDAGQILGIVLCLWLALSAIGFVDRLLMHPLMWLVSLL